MSPYGGVLGPTSLYAQAFRTEKKLFEEEVNRREELIEVELPVHLLQHCCSSCRHNRTICYTHSYPAHCALALLLPVLSMRGLEK